MVIITTTPLQGWIFALVSLFSIGVLTIVVLEGSILTYVVPALENVVNNDIGVPMDNETVTEINAGFASIIRWWRIMPYVLFFVIIIYMIFLAIRKEEESEYSGGQYVYENNQPPNYGGQE